MDEFNYSALQKLIQFKTDSDDSPRSKPDPSQIDPISFVRDPYPVDKDRTYRPCEIYFLDPIEVAAADDASDSDIDEDIIAMIKSKMRAEIIDVVKRTAKEHEVPCASATDDEISVVCSLCNVIFTPKHFNS
jgi:hypothetical protein